MSKQNTKPIPVRFYIKQIELLKAEAKKKFMNISELIRYIVTKYFENKE